MYQKHKNTNSSARWYWFVSSFLVVCYMVGCGTASDIGSAGPTASQRGVVQTTPTKPKQTQQVEESDLYRKKGDLLFYLHAYKGLTIFSMSDATKPKRLSNLPVYGYPVEMFVGDKTAFVMVRYPVTMTRAKISPQYRVSLAPSQLISIDISNPEQPKLLHRITIHGTLLPGHSRKVGNTIYLITYNPKVRLNADAPSEMVLGQTFLHTYFVGQPSKLKLVSFQGIRTTDLLPVLASGSNVLAKVTNNRDDSALRLEGDPDLRSDRLLLHSLQPMQYLGAVMTATPKRLVIASNFIYRAGMTIAPPGTGPSQPRSFGGFGNCNGRNRTFPSRVVPPTITTQLNYTVIRIYDISDPSGRVKEHSHFMVQGYMSDQFKQTIVNDKTQDSALYLGIVRRNALQISASRITSQVQNLLLSIDIRRSEKPVLRHMVAFGKPGESVRGSLFDAKRQVVYAITATGIDEQDKSADRVDIERRRRERLRIRDPLYALSYKNPDKLESLGNIDELSGDINLFRLIEGGQYLLAVGRDNSSACTGFNKDTGIYSRTAVSIVDARNLSKLRLVQRRCVSINPSIAVVSSNVNWDRDQAHKYIGMYESSSLNLVAVPVRYNDTKEKKDHTAIGLMRWDINRYQKNLPNTSQTVLSDMGTLEHPQQHGALQRLLFYNNSSTPRGPVLVSLAETNLSVASLADLSKPKAVATLEIALDVDAVYPLGEYIVTQIKPSLRGVEKSSPRYKKLQETRILRVDRIKQATRGEPLAQLTLENVRNVLQWKQYLLVFREITSSQTELRVIDLQNPSQPKVGARVYVAYIPEFLQSASIQGHSNVLNQSWASMPNGILFAYSPPGQNTKYLGFLDMRQPSQPKLQQLKKLQDNSEKYNVLRVNDTTALLSIGPNSSTTRIQSSWIQQWTWQTNRWTEGLKRTFPGHCMKVYQKEGQLLYLSGIGNPYSGYTNITLYQLTKARNSFMQLSRTYLTDRVSQRVALHGDRISIHSRHDGLKVYRVTKTKLEHTITLALKYTFGKHNKPSDLFLELGYGPYLQFRVSNTGGILWLQLPKFNTKDGVKSLFFAPNFTWKLDPKNPNNPQFQPRNTQHVVLWNNKAYVASGPFGLLTFDFRQSNILQE